MLRERVRQELLLRRVLPQTAEPEPPAPVATLFWDQDEEEERDRDRDNPGGCFRGLRARARHRDNRPIHNFRGEETN